MTVYILLSFILQFTTVSLSFLVKFILEHFPSQRYIDKDILSLFKMQSNYLLFVSIDCLNLKSIELLKVKGCFILSE